MPKKANTPSKLIYICTGEKCKKRGSKEITKVMRRYTEDQGLEDVGIIKTHCTDNCDHGPVICLQPENTWHFRVEEHNAIVLLKRLAAETK